MKSYVKKNVKRKKSVHGNKSKQDLVYLKTVSYVMT